MPRRLLVIEGADQGRNYWLPDEGMVLIGSSHRHAEVALNDMWVKRTHCHLKLDPESVFLSRVENHETLVNNVSVAEKALILGDVIRVGNSHLRLEEADQVEGEDEIVEGEMLPDEPEFEVVDESEPEVPAFPRQVPVEELARQTFNHYQIETALGQGHLGVVFRARDQKTNSLVALKLLTPDFPQNSAEMQPYVQAIKTGLPLRHPNLVTWLGAGRTGNYCWIAMEYIEGETVAEVVERISDGRKIRWKRALHVGLELAEALEFIGRHRLVHGNITPENVLIRREERVAKLSDLMLRTALEGSKVYEAVLPRKRLTEIAYLAPELLDAAVKPTGLSDLYSLGAVMYALLTGRPPFKAENFDATREQVRDTPPEKPRAFQRAIPNDMQAIVLRLMAKKPEDRYPSPAALLEDLQRCERMHEEPPAAE